MVRSAPCGTSGTRRASCGYAETSGPSRRWCSWAIASMAGMVGCRPRWNAPWAGSESDRPAQAGVLVRLDAADVSVPRFELLVGRVGRAGGRPVRRSVDAVLPLQEVPPHVDGEAAEEGPLEDVDPVEGVASQRPPELEGECTGGDDEPGGQGEMEPERVLSGQPHRLLADLSHLVGLDTFHCCHPTAAVVGPVGGADHCS